MAYSLEEFARRFLSNLKSDDPIVYFEPYNKPLFYVITMTDRIKELQTEVEALHDQKKEIGHQQFALKVKNSSLDKKLKAIEWEIEQLKTIPEKDVKEAD